MRIRVRFFASLRERLRVSEAEREIRDGATVGELWAALCADYPQIAPLGAALSFAVNQEYVDRDHRLANDDEVACIPPVSGGVDVRDRAASH